MAAKFNAETLKKHHFWFLFIVVFIGLLLAWIGLFFEVPGETTGALEAQNGKKNGQSSVQAKPRALIAKYTDQVKELEVKRINMWRQAWNEQKDLYFWPAKQPAVDNDPLAVMDANRVHYLDDPLHGFTDKQLAVVANLKFAADIPSKENVRGQFVNPEIYEATYKKLIGELTPMQFREDWQTLLKYVQGWKKGVTPPSEEIWLAMEDLWVQHEFLTRINQVNIDAAKFACVADAMSSVVGPAGSMVDQLVESRKKIIVEDPKNRVFRSRLWRLEIKIADENNKRVLKGRLKNLTNRLQVFGVGNVLNLKVWTADPEKNRPHPFQIEGVSVPAGAEIEIKPIASHELPPEWSAKGIFKVEQVFDIRTLPVKRIEYLEIGKLSDRNSNLPLRMAKFSEDMAAKETPSTGGGGGTTPTGPAGPMGQPTTGGPMGGYQGSGGPTGEGQGAVANAKTPQHQLNRLRYIDVTEQLRRIPIGLVVVTDQTYLKDVVESIANTKMRFQTTQVEWARFHSTLNYRTGGSSGGTGEDTPPRTGLTSPMGSSPLGSMLGSGLGYGSGLGFGQGSGGPDNSSQDQFSANLMELSVYGIISLYEKYDEPKGGAAKKDKDPTPGVKPKDKEPSPMPMPKEKDMTPTPPAMKDPDPKVPDPNSKDPAGKDPMPVNPKS